MLLRLNRKQRLVKGGEGEFTHLQLSQSNLQKFGHKREATYATRDHNFLPEDILRTSLLAEESISLDCGWPYLFTSMASMAQQANMFQWSTYVDYLTCQITLHTFSNKKLSTTFSPLETLCWRQTVYLIAHFKHLRVKYRDRREVWMVAMGPNIEKRHEITNKANRIDRIAHLPSGV